ncbi:AarF/ABC1/UbiB kinase family protein [Myxococcota bacterium]|nr:AarF/ABC1/UbiB kinase family protein [Myxococcota bacterium]MBU1383022.1 AarF/ABC1/UbiB kinase family protein [Myxococcota bacterium]MBU1495787.1 AarF/ABC1/UbiB kinase family protein [Myxococcota bacterium]
MRVKKNTEELNKIPVSTIHRTGHFASAGLKCAGCYLSNLISGFTSPDIDADKQKARYRLKQASIFALELGRMKGTAMKAGQLLGLIGTHFGISPEICNVFSQLNDKSAPLAWGAVKENLDKFNNGQLYDEFEISPVAHAAASLGQVHRAVHRETGKECCFKIQYPEVARSLDSDLRAIRIALGIANFLPEGLNPDPMLAEIRMLFESELDYLREINFMKEFSTRLQGTGIHIPEVWEEFSSPTFICMEFIDGVTLDHEDVLCLDPAERNEIAYNLTELVFREIFSWNMMQTDPNMGNYLVDIDNPRGPVLDLIDFGAVRIFDENFIRAYRQLVKGAWLKDYDRMHYAIRELDFMPSETPRSVRNQFCELASVAMEPFHTERYNWAQSDLPARMSRLALNSSLTRYFRLPPSEILFLHRKLAGVFACLGMLEADFNTYELAYRYLS